MTSHNVTDYDPEITESSHTNSTAAVLTIMAVVIFIENSIVCLLFVTDKKLRTTTNIFVVSLAISDLLVGILFVPVYLGTAVGHQVNLYIVTFLLFSSLFNLCGVTYDRYHAILQPLTYLVVFTRCRIATVLVFTWFLPLLIIALPFTWSRSADHEFIARISRFYLGFLVSTVFFTFIFISKVYYSIFKAIKRQMKMTQHVQGMFVHSSFPSTDSFETKLNERSPHNNYDVGPESPHISPCPETKSLTGYVIRNNNLTEKQLRKQRFKKYSEKVFSDIRAAKLFAFIIIIFIICWLPVVFINFMVAINRIEFVPKFIFDISVYAFVANALVNPLIYTFYKKDYRQALLKLAGFGKNAKKFDTVCVEMLELEH